ncbi:MAG: LuxR family transcriptional regulator, partial [Bacteroidota bacterium]
ARSTEIKYDSERVCVCEVSKPKNFLQFVFLSQGAEFEHLRQLTDSDKDKRAAEALDMKASGVSNVAIAQRFGVTEGAVRYWLKKTKSDTTS